MSLSQQPTTNYQRPPVGREGLIEGERSVWLREPGGKLFRPTPKQIEFFRAVKPGSDYNRVVMVGGAGAGKTTVMCAALILLMLKYPNTTWLMGRLNYRGLVTVTWRMFRQMLPKECLLYASDNAQDLRVVLKNGATLYGWNLAQWERFQGLNLAGAVIDEQTELPDRMIYDALALRVRDPNGPRVIFSACMPNGRDWVWRLFFADPPDGFLGIKATSHDNPHLPDNFIPDLKKQFSPEMYARFVDAEFTSLSGLVFYPWDETIHVVDDFDIPKHWPRFFALDPGFAQDEAAALWAACDEFGNLFLYDEYYELGKVIREQAAVILAKTYPAKLEWRVMDPNANNRQADSGQSLQDLYAQAGLYLTEAPRQRTEPSVAAVNQLLLPDPEHFHPLTGYSNAPRIYCLRKCSHFRDEVSGWTYKPNGKPREKNDHLMAALRYLVARRPHPAAKVSRVPRDNAWRQFWEGIGEEATGGLPLIGGHA